MKVACILFLEDLNDLSIFRVAENFLKFSPQIALSGDRALFIEIGKCSRLYSEESFIRRVKYFLNKHGLKAQISLGREATEALALAKYNVSDEGLLPLMSLLEFADPFFRDQDLQKSVAKLIANFEDLGVTQISQFKKLPLGELIARFGVLGRFLHHRVHYKDQLHWTLWKPEELITEKKDFLHSGYDGNLEPLMFDLKILLDNVFIRLKRRSRQVTQLELQIQCEKLSVHPNYLRTLVFDFFAPQTIIKGTLKILMERLTREFERNPIKSPIESMQLKVLKSVAFDGGQKNLFNNDEEKFEKIFSVHNQLVEMLGKDNVYQVKLTQDRRPERSWVKEFGKPHERLSKKADNETEEFDITELIPERTTYLCRRPIKIDVTAGYIHIRKRRYKILHWDNQIERINGGWYENPGPEIPDTIKDSFDRTYSEVTIENHQRLSIFQTPTKDFFLHGYFG